MARKTEMMNLKLSRSERAALEVGAAFDGDSKAAYIQHLIMQDAGRKMEQYGQLYREKYNEKMKEIEGEKEGKEE